MSNIKDTASMAAVREALARLAENKKARSVDKRHRWYPDRVNRDGARFTPSGAWRYIAELLRDPDQPIEEIVLNKPPGQKAYVMKVYDEESKSRIYIKVHFGNGKIIGRSFHYSDRE